MASGAGSHRRRLPAVGGVISALVLLAAALELAGAFSGDESAPGVGPASSLASRKAPAATSRGGPGLRPPAVETFRVGGRPAAVAAGEGTAWVADAFSEVASRVAAGAPKGPQVTSFPLDGGPAAGVAAGEGGAWYILQGEESVERRDPVRPARPGERTALDGFGSAIAVGEGSVWVLAGSSIARIEPSSGEVVDETAAGGFATSLAVADRAVWVIADNREVVKLDPESGEVLEPKAEVVDAVNLAAGRGSVWVVSATGTVTRIDARSLAAVGDPVRVHGALDVAVGEGAVWVTSSDSTLTRIDIETGKVLGEALRVGEDPVDVDVGEGSVWVANAGDGTVTRIRP